MFDSVDYDFDLVREDEEEGGDLFYIDFDDDSESEDFSVEKSTPMEQTYGFNGWDYESGSVAARQTAFRNYIEEIAFGLTFLKSLLKEKTSNEESVEVPITVKFDNRSDITLEKISGYLDFLLLISQTKTLAVKLGAFYKVVDALIRKPLRDALRRIKSEFLTSKINDEAVSKIYSLLNEENWKRQSKTDPSKNLIKGALSRKELNIPTVSSDNQWLHLPLSPITDGQRFLNSVTSFEPDTLRRLLETYLKDQLINVYLNFLWAHENKTFSWFEAIEKRIKDDVIARLSGREKPFTFEEVIRVKREFDAVMREAMQQKEIPTRLLRVSIDKISRSSLNDLSKSDHWRRIQLSREDIFVTPEIKDRLTKISKILDAKPEPDSDEEKKNRILEKQRRQKELEEKQKAASQLLKELSNLQVTGERSEIDLSSHPLKDDEVIVLSSYFKKHAQIVKTVLLNDCQLSSYADLLLDAIEKMSALEALDLGNNPDLDEGFVDGVLQRITHFPIKTLNLSGCSFDENELYEFMTMNKTYQVLILRDVKSINPEKLRDAVFRSHSLNSVVLPSNTPWGIRHEIANTLLTRHLNQRFKNDDKSLEAFKNNLDIENATTLRLNLTTIRDLQPIIDWLQWLNTHATKELPLKRLKITGAMKPEIANQFENLLMQLPALEGISFHAQFVRDKGAVANSLGTCLRAIKDKKPELKHLSIQGRESFQLTDQDVNSFVLPVLRKLEHLETFKLQNHGLKIKTFKDVAEKIHRDAPLKRFSFRGNRLNRAIGLLREGLRFLLEHSEFGEMDLSGCLLSDKHLSLSCHSFAQSKGGLLKFDVSDNRLRLKHLSLPSCCQREVVVDVTSNGNVSTESWKSISKKKKIHFVTSGILDSTGHKSDSTLRDVVKQRNQAEEKLETVLNKSELLPNDLASEANDVSFGCQRVAFRIPYNDEKRTALCDWLVSSQNEWKKFVITIPEGFDLHQVSGFCEALANRMPEFYSLNSIEVETLSGADRQVIKGVFSGRFQSFVQEHADFQDLKITVDGETVNRNLSVRGAQREERRGYRENRGLRRR
ncbi:MAG: hypothetical protein ABIH77_03190 [Pseudomonadota bacterium]